MNPASIHSLQHNHKEKICEPPSQQQPSNTPIEATSRWINIGERLLLKNAILFINMCANVFSQQLCCNNKEEISFYQVAS